MSTIYLAGPMLGVADPKAPFIHAAAVLRGMGHTVLSPAEQEAPTHLGPSGGCLPGSQERAYYMRADFEMVLAADLLVVLSGWEKSAGASAEVILAIEIGTPVCTFPGLEEMPPKFPKFGWWTVERARVMEDTLSDVANLRYDSYQDAAMSCAASLAGYDGRAKSGRPSIPRGSEGLLPA